MSKRALDDSSLKQRHSTFALRSTTLSASQPQNTWGSVQTLPNAGRSFSTTTIETAQHHPQTRAVWLAWITLTCWRPIVGSCFLILTASRVLMRKVTRSSADTFQRQVLYPRTSFRKQQTDCPSHRKPPRPPSTYVCALINGLGDILIGKQVRAKSNKRLELLSKPSVF